MPLRGVLFPALEARSARRPAGKELPGKSSMICIDRRLAPALFFCAVAFVSCAEKRAALEPPAPAMPPAERPMPEALPLPIVKGEAIVTLDRAPMVRVLVLANVSSLSLEVPGSFAVGVDPAAEPVARMSRGGKLSVRRSGKEIVLGEGRRRIFAEERVSIVPENGGFSTLNGKRYRGAFLFAVAGGGVAAINVLDIDEYLKGVLPSEIGHLKPGQYEAYRAQAIAARSYALSKLEEKRGELYDLNATVMDQVYAGVSGENEDANRAVEATRGLVCYFLGVPVRAYYCSCCGGHTADIRVVWPWKTPYPYLYGVRDTVPGMGGESLCRGSRHFRWRAHWTAASLEAVLRRTIPRELGVPAREVGKVIDVELLGTSRDGRAEGVEIVTDRESFVVRGDRVRWVLKPDPASDAILRSTLFNMDVSFSSDRVATVDLLGGGNGHGVGMCQSGAIRMAEIGYRGEQIIEHYYPGVRIVTLYR
jgi:stage II sporulation protein D